MMDPVLDAMYYKKSNNKVIFKALLDIVKAGRREGVNCRTCSAFLQQLFFSYIVKLVEFLFLMKM